MDIKLPPLGEGADSGVVVNLFVKEGDTVRKDQPLLELENEKAVAAIPSTAAGTVTRVHVKPGERISVGQVLLTVAVAGEVPALASAPSAGAARLPEASARPGEAPRPAEPSEAAPAEDDLAEGAQPAPAAAPSLRRLARDLGIDLGRVRGSERGGRVVLADLRAYIQRLERLAAQARAGAAKPTPAAGEAIDFSQFGPVHIKPLTSLRKVIARRMLESWSTVPRVTQFDEADGTGLIELRRKHGPAYEERGARLTLTVFLIKAVVGVLQKHPEFNSSLDASGQNLVYKAYYHLGLAVDTPAGLIVPVLRDADKKSLVEIARALEDLARRARERKLTPDELRGGTFTISNQGGLGGGHFTPIVNHPETAILGVGRAAVRPVWRDGQWVPRTMLPLAVSYDHRVIDGGQAARFTTDLVAALERFDEAQVQL